MIFSPVEPAPEDKPNDLGERVKQLDWEIDALKGRWPLHSVPPNMFERFGEVDQALDEGRKAGREG